MLDTSMLLEQARRFDSFYLYDQKAILAHAARLREAIPWADFLYSVKTNPHGRVLETVFGQGFGADAASLGEVRLARQKGLPPEQIYYSAPGKTVRDLEAALGDCVLIADSLGEVGRIETLAAAQNRVVSIGLRLNPDFTLTADKGLSGKFGIDEELLWERFPWLLGLPHVKVVGIHVHLKSQELSHSVLRRYYEKLFELAALTAQRLQRPLEFVNLGSGLGIPFAEGDEELDVTALGQGAAPGAKAFQDKFPATRLLIETGRYIAGAAGLYVTRVVDVKESRGKRYVLLANTLNGFIRPCLEQLVGLYTDAEQPPMNEPLFTCRKPYRIVVVKGGGPLETVNLVGNLCTAADIVAKDVSLPHLEEGDVLAFTNAGAYSAVLSPMQFASMAAPPQLFLTKVGQVLES